ncbi:MAG TPA: hypothetical protein VG820_05475, partial [Fimbriimonadaceae bacterium]|nr:hypothetical protein [Fimbriimonadaceae bacterium]
MTLEAFLTVLREQPLIVSVQASPGSAVEDTDTLLRLAQASLAQGVRVLRLEGAERVARIREATGAPVIGLIKRVDPDSPVYITPTAAEVDALLGTGCEAVALDATVRQTGLRSLVERIHKGKAL